MTNRDLTETLPVLEVVILDKNSLHLTKIFYSWFASTWFNLTFCSVVFFLQNSLILLHAMFIVGDHQHGRIQGGARGGCSPPPSFSLAYATKS